MSSLVYIPPNCCVFLQQEPEAALADTEEYKNAQEMLEQTKEAAGQ